MGAAATVSKDDEACDQKASTSLKSSNKNTAMVICSGCKTQLSIFKRKSVRIFSARFKLMSVYAP